MVKRTNSGAADNLVKRKLADASIEPKRPVSTHASGFGMLKYTWPPLKKRLVDVDVTDLMREAMESGRK